mgnify:CR=1 FL=1
MSGDLPKLQLDKDAISRVLINLIKNSIEAKKNKTTLNILIKSRLNSKDRVVRLTIIDDGDHSLSRTKDLNKIDLAIKKII